MSRDIHRTGVFVQVLLAVALIVLATLAGFWLGSLGRPAPRVSNVPVTGGEPAGPVFQEEHPESSKYEPPIYLLVNTAPGADLAAIIDEVRMAGDAGIHNLVVSVPLPWGEDQRADAALELLTNLTEANPKAEFIAWLSVHPPESWLAEHQQAAVRIGDEFLSAPTLASDVWEDAAERGLTTLVEGLEASPHKERVRGYLLSCLESGSWYRPGPYDRSEANAAAFRQWLQERYHEEAALQAAWDVEDVTFAEAAIPDEPESKDPPATKVFFELPAQQNQVDYLEYVSEFTARVIARLVLHVKNTAEIEPFVMVPYGYSFELTSTRLGHAALQDLLVSEVDGFVSPVSYSDRGLGGVGGFMGPIDSAAAHGKKWFIVDDTRTGIARDPVSGKVERMAGLYTEDVFNVLCRNFSGALAHGTGLFWADAGGDGRFLDRDIWQRFERMAKAYEAIWADTEETDEDQSRQEKHPRLLAVVDEKSRFYQQCDDKLNELLLKNARDCVLRAGVPAGFCLLSDVLDDLVGPADVYLFLNTSSLNEDARERLHQKLADEEAAAIWLYAPGYIGEEGPSAQSVAATVGIPVKAFEEPTQAGSIFGFAGEWMSKDEPFGSPQQWDPLFYIDDPDTNIIATYKESEKPSIAMQFTEEGWTSVFIADPLLSPALLREILRLLEVRSCFLPTASPFFDVAHLGPNLIAIHASTDAERLIDLDGVFTVQDMVDPEIGWPQKTGLNLTLRTGQTRIFQLIPETPED